MYLMQHKIIKRRLSEYFIKEYNELNKDMSNGLKDLFFLTAVKKINLEIDGGWKLFTVSFQNIVPNTYSRK